MIVLDTKVVSELMRAAPAPAVLARLQQTSGTGLYTTSVTVAEIRYGIARLPDGRRKHDLHQAANEIFAAFPRQVLPFDSSPPAVRLWTWIVFADHDNTRAGRRCGRTRCRIEPRSNLDRGAPSSRPRAALQRSAVD